MVHTRTAASLDPEAPGSTILRRTGVRAVINSGGRQMSGGRTSADPRTASGTPAEAHPAIRLRGVRKTFGPVVAVDDVDLDIADGEFFAMLGPSGSGKTTVLRMIAGFERPTAGTRRPRRQRRDPAAAVPTRRQHRLPGLRAVPAHDRGAERRVRPAGAPGRPRPSGPAGSARRWRWCGWAASAPRRPHAALRRPAAAGRPGPRPGEPAPGAAARRAARRARPQAARADAARAQGASSARSASPSSSSPTTRTRR